MTIHNMIRPKVNLLYSMPTILPGMRMREVMLLRSEEDDGGRHITFSSSSIVQKFQKIYFPIISSYSVSGCKIVLAPYLSIVSINIVFGR